MPENPSVLSRPAPPPGLLLRYGRHPDQVIDVWSGDDRAATRPLAVFLHGGFWRPEYDRTHVRPLGQALCVAGWSVASIEYRRSPGRPAATVDDVRAALGRLPRLLTGVPYDGTLVLLGHSAGGHLALWAAAVVKPSGLRGTVALAPVADLELAERLRLGDGAVPDFLGASATSRADLDPVRLPTPPTPVSVVHGARDTIVPLAVAESYATGHPATRLVRLAEAGHYEVIDPLSPVWPLVTAELTRSQGRPVRPRGA